MRCESCSCILDGSSLCFSSKENPLICESCYENYLLQMQKSAGKTENSSTTKSSVPEMPERIGKNKKS